MKKKSKNVTINIDKLIDKIEIRVGDGREIFADVFSCYMSRLIKEATANGTMQK